MNTTFHNPNRFVFWKHFQKGSQKADEYIRIIKDQLEIAVSQCIEAAGHEIDPSKQKPLLRVCIKNLNAINPAQRG